MKTVIKSTNGTTYQLSADKYSFTLCELVESKGEKSKGELVERNHTHHPKLEMVFERLNHLELSKSDAQTLQDIEKVFRATRHLVKAAGWTKEDVK